MSRPPFAPLLLILTSAVTLPASAMPRLIAIAISEPALLNRIGR